MPRKPDGFWRERVKELTVNANASGVRFGPESVLSALMTRYKGLTEADQSKHGKPPSKATIGRIQHEVRGMPKEKREQYLWFYWPESMERELLPWEASRPLLHLLAQDLWLGVRPQISVCRWYWKLYQAAPDAPHHGLENLARMLATWEMQGAIPDRKFREVEGWLAFRGWVTVERGHRLRDMDYTMAVQLHIVPPLQIDFEEPAEATEDDMASRREMFMPISKEVVRHHAQITAAERADREQRDKEKWARFQEGVRRSGRPTMSPVEELKAWVRFQEEEKEDDNGEAQA